MILILIIYNKLTATQKSQNTMTSNPFECGICYNEFTTQGDHVPLSLTCGKGHTMCSKCWDNSVKEFRALIRCPFCRGTIQHSTVSPTQPKNIQLCAAIEKRNETTWPQFNNMLSISVIANGQSSAAENIVGLQDRIKRMIQESKDLSTELDRKRRLADSISERIVKLEEEYCKHSHEINIKLKDLFDRAERKRKIQLDVTLQKMYDTQREKISKLHNTLREIENAKRETIVELEQQFKGIRETKENEIDMLSNEIDKLSNEIDKLSKQLSDIKNEHIQKMWVERCKSRKFESSKQSFINDYYRIIPVIQHLQEFVNTNHISFNDGQSNIKDRYKLSMLLKTISGWDINSYVTKVNPFIQAMDTANTTIQDVDNYNIPPIDENFRIAYLTGNVTPKTFEIIYDEELYEPSVDDNTNTELLTIKCILCKCSKTIPDKCSCDMPQLHCSIKGCYYDSDEETQFNEIVSNYKHQ